MSYTLHYASSRSEVWRWHWRSWRQRLWLTHVAMALVLGLVAATAGGRWPTPGGWLRASLVALPFVVAAFAAFPQFAFKPQARVLDVGPAGWSTTVGRQSASRRWSEVAAVEEHGAGVVIRSMNGNALIVPARAFASEAQRLQFLADARRWHAAA